MLAYQTPHPAGAGIAEHSLVLVGKTQNLLQAAACKKHMSHPMLHTKSQQKL